MKHRIKLGDPVWEFVLDWEKHLYPVFSMRKVGEVKDVGRYTIRVGTKFHTLALNLSQFFDEDQCKEETFVSGYRFKHYATSPKTGKAVCRLVLENMRRMRKDDLEKAQKKHEAGLRPVEGLEKE